MCAKTAEILTHFMCTPYQPSTRHSHRTFSDADLRARRRTEWALRDKQGACEGPAECVERGLRVTGRLYCVDSWGGRGGVAKPLQCESKQSEVGVAGSAWLSTRFGGIAQIAAAAG